MSRASLWRLLFFAALGGCGVVVAAALGGFGSPRHSEVGEEPFGLVAADLDGDGDTDVAVSSNDPDDGGVVSVLANEGDGGLADPVDYEIEGEARGLAVADLDADDRPDLAVALPDVGVAVLRGRRDGSFGSPRELAAGGPGAGQTAVAVADLDRDGRDDLVVVARSAGRVHVLAGQPGPGLEFAPPVDFEVGPQPEGIAAGDLDGDRLPDLVVPSGGSGSASLLYGRLDGGLRSGLSLRVGRDPRSAQVADLDGDGRNDLAVANAGSDDVTVAFGRRDGSLTAPERFDAGKAPVALDAGDADDDGDVDLVTANFDDDTVTVLSNEGDRSFASPDELDVHEEPQQVVAAHLDGNDKLDLAVANAGSGDVSVLFYD